MGTPHTMLNVQGAMEPLVEKNGLYVSQEWRSKPRPVSSEEWGARRFIRAIVRFDDRCGNGHASFSITGEIYRPGARDVDACGCIHEEIARYFPELAPLIKWHLCSTDGPMHYVSNAVYFAGDRDCWGLRKGEKRQIRNGKTGALCWRLETVSPDNMPPKTFEGDEPPTVDVRYSYAPWCRVGEGKARELDAARRVAIWPEATDEQLCAEPSELKAALEARLPQLIATFRHDMEAAGLLWAPAERAK